MNDLKPPRVIKFRLRGGSKILGYEWWWRGDQEQGPKWLYSKDGQVNWSPEFIPHTDKDQFTGLQDKNGKEIYEGDIVKTLPGKEDLHEVEFWKGGFILNTKAEGVDHRYYFGHYKKEELEIIGNIYENPDLLGKTK